MKTKQKQAKWNKGRLKGRVKNLGKARKLRAKRKAAKAKAARSDAPAPSSAEWARGDVLPTSQAERRLRGDGPPVRNVRMLLNATAPGSSAPERSCQSCTKKANHYLEWEYWHRGEWRRARRNLCGKHAERKKKSLGQAKAS